MSESVPPPSEPDPIPFAPDIPPVNPPPPMYTPLTTPPTTDYASAAYPGSLSPANKDEQTMGMLAHLLGIFTGFLGPLIIWLVKKDQSKYIDEQSKEALNFQISALIVILGCLAFVFIPFLGLCLVPLLSVAAHITRLVFSIIGTVEANKGQMYRYPLTYRFIK